MCLDRCTGGPEAVWCSYVDAADIDETVDSHLIGGNVVTQLVLPADVGR